MSSYLLDTNVISELTKRPPDSNVLTFFSSEHDFWLPVIALEEVQYGLQLLPAGRRRSELESAMSIIITAYEDRILPLYREAAEYAGTLRAQAQRSGRLLRVNDALIAGIAIANDLSLATRNVADFDYLPIEVTNPWQES
ncbi:MAG: type II toxin-antitoxin system VapC family toxin [Chloroflexi bacterium]|nr:type II toxin-antitoxin system VapC family toxin [Chloroflexota bacterium]